MDPSHDARTREYPFDGMARVIPLEVQRIIDDMSHIRRRLYSPVKFALMIAKSLGKNGVSAHDT